MAYALRHSTVAAVAACIKWRAPRLGGDACGNIDPADLAEIWPAMTATSSAEKPSNRVLGRHALNGIVARADSAAKPSGKPRLRILCRKLPCWRRRPDDRPLLAAATPPAASTRRWWHRRHHVAQARLGRSIGVFVTRRVASASAPEMASPAQAAAASTGFAAKAAEMGRPTRRRRER